MPIANYSTIVPVARTLAEIQQLLAHSGAQAVMIDYEHSIPVAIAFRIIRGRLQLGFRLPCDWQATLKVLCADSAIPRRLRTNEHAQRVAWRVLRDWLRAQLTLIEVGAASLEQVMLPYAITPTGETFYERMRGADFNQLALPVPSASAS